MKKILIGIILMVGVLVLAGCNKSFDISFGYKSLTMNAGETLVLSTNYKDISDEGEVIWESSDEEVATIDQDGKIIALKEGSTYITATFKDHISKIYLSVSSSWIDNRKIIISGEQMVFVNSKSKLNASIDLKDDEFIVWSSLNNKIATVDQTGNVKGVTSGLVTIRATLSSNNAIYTDTTMFVRGENWLQNVVYNYIYSDTYRVSGDINLMSLNNAVTTVVEENRDSIIGISRYVYQNQAYVLGGVGSAVIIEREEINGGYKYKAITNYHVIDNGAKITAYIGNEVDAEMPATIVKTNLDYDLALVEFNYDQLIKPVTIAKEDAVSCGDFVLSIGNPTGYEFYNSVTFGVVSYVDRKIEGKAPVYIQHDAAINSGNSGGGLINIKGELVGINTLKISKLSAEGLNFAINIKTLNEFLNQA